MMSLWLCKRTVIAFDVNSIFEMTSSHCYQAARTVSAAPRRSKCLESVSAKKEGRRFGCEVRLSGFKG